MAAGPALHQADLFGCLLGGFEQLRRFWIVEGIDHVHEQNGCPGTVFHVSVQG